MSDDGVFDEEVAATYDQVHGGSNSDLVDQTAKLLKDLTNGGAALEFAVGTGRIALPLKGLGVDVSGIELSKAMVAELRRKETGSAMDIAIGDMTSTRMDGSFALVFLVYNTIDNLTTQEAQVACFENAAAHLEPGGRFLIETLVPPIQKIPFGETKRAFSCMEEHWGIDEFDIVTQQYTSHHARFQEGTFKKLSVPFRYAWPAEFDLMARLAGLTLEHRWADWNKSPFTNTSRSHISVWRKSS